MQTVINLHISCVLTTFNKDDVDDDDDDDIQTFTRTAWRYTGCANMNFFVKAFENYHLTDRET